MYLFSDDTLNEKSSIEIHGLSSRGLCSLKYLCEFQLGKKYKCKNIK